MPTHSANLSDDIEEIILDPEKIAGRIQEMGQQISKDYQGKDLVLVGILRGALVFLSDLSRAIDIPHSWDMVGASSYGSATSSSGRVQITKDVEVNLRGKDVIVIEDIYDSGRTLTAISDLLKVHHPRSVALCTFLWKKKASRSAISEIQYRGFEIDDKFVVGYGLDFDEKYRNLPYVGILKKEVYEDA